MCGICGQLVLGGEPAMPAVVERMCQALVHRGPDAGGLHVDGPVALGSRRLRVLDPSGGVQPMRNEDGSVSLVFNGEIYNFAELRKRLLDRGHDLRSRSDTETIVHLYEERGEECVIPLRGMFAFALWDARKRRLLLARDRLGKKPLYYTVHDGSLWFASELKALLQVPGLPRRIDPAALELYLTYRFVPGPRTIFAGVSKLPPGHTLSIGDGTLEVRRYWQLSPTSGRRLESADEARERLAQLLEESVRLRTVADVPIGAFLSGGLDSSLIVGLLSRVSSAPVKTFSVGFPGFGELDELGFARQVSRHFGTDHHELLLTPPDLLTAFPGVVWHLDEPLGDAAAIPTLLLSRLARQDVTVALTGEGADELFAGYPHFRRERQVGRLEPWLPRPAAAALARLLEQTGPRRLGRAARLLSLTRAARHRSYRAVFDLPAPLEPAPFSFADPIQELTYTEIGAWLADDLLMKVDKMSMAVSLEARAPYLDQELVELAFSLPTGMKLRGGQDKWILRQVAQAILPAEICQRAKHGFDLPLDTWLRVELKPLVDELLGPEGLPRRGLVDPAILATATAGHLAGRRNAAQQIWTLICLEQWCRAFLDGSPA